MCTFIPLVFNCNYMCMWLLILHIAVWLHMLHITLLANMLPFIYHCVNQFYHLEMKSICQKLHEIACNFWQIDFKKLCIAS